ncbi:hypothetical protein [Streptomyces sp. NPDC091416]|uniref:hypothetical protein n=1 Tax=Streptomyces sp. NPDC091416 TaxID=3366003 RepID=UPI003804E44B
MASPKASGSRPPLRNDVDLVVLVRAGCGAVFAAAREFCRATRARSTPLNVVSSFTPELPSRWEW